MATNTQHDKIDDATSFFLKGLSKQREWELAPYGYWIERSGSKVIFDRGYRPIARIHLSGEREIIPTNEIIIYQAQHWYHTGFAWGPDCKTRDIVTRLIDRYGLGPELSRRRLLQKTQDLPRCNVTEADRANKLAATEVNERDLRP